MRQLKGARLQPFVVQDKAPGLPVQELGLVPCLVDEDIDRTIIGAPPQFPEDQPAQPIKALAHVRWGEIEMEP